MALTLFTSAILASLELAINEVLKLDPACQKKIISLNGSVLAIRCHAPSLEIFLIVREQKLVLASYYEGKPDTLISGRADALLKLLLTKDKNSAFYNDNLEVEGNLELAQALQKILTQINIDWEYHLSKFIGDIPTQTLSTSISSTQEFVRNTHASLAMDLDEYIHEEATLFPTPNDLENFYNAIDALRLKVDRAEARTNLLIEKNR